MNVLCVIVPASLSGRGKCVDSPRCCNGCRHEYTWTQYPVLSAPRESPCPNIAGTPCPLACRTPNRTRACTVSTAHYWLIRKPHKIYKQCMYVQSVLIRRGMAKTFGILVCSMKRLNSSTILLGDVYNLREVCHHKSIPLPSTKPCTTVGTKHFLRSILVKLVHAASVTT